MKKKPTPATSSRKPKTTKTSKATATTLTIPRSTTPAVESPPTTFRYGLVPDGDAGGSSRLKHLAERIAALAAAESGGDWVGCEIVLEVNGIGGLRTLLRVEGPCPDESRAHIRD